MPLEYETVAIPVTKGVNLTTEARLIEPPHLLEAYNSRLGKGGGSSKRRGHTGVIARTPAPIPLQANPTDSQWVFGWGYNLYNYRLSGDDVACGVSDHPQVGRLYGVAQRDQETVLWSGHSLLSYSPGEAADPETISANVGNAVMPHLTATPVAKTPTSQVAPEVADNGVIKVVAWMDLGTTSVHYSVYDSVSGAQFVVNATLAGVVVPYQVRSVTMGNYVHLFVTDVDDGNLKTYSFHEELPTSAPVFRNYGPCVKYFDIYKLSETVTAVAKSNTATTQQIDITWMGTTGAGYVRTDRGPFTILPAGNPPIDLVAVGVHPLTGNVGVAWHTTAGHSVFCGTYDPLGTIIGNVVTLKNTGANPRHLTMAPKYVLSSSSDELWDVYWDGANNTVFKQRTSTTVVIGSLLTRYNLTIGSSAFRVGDRTYLFLGHPASLQSTWFLADENLDPVGHQDWATARTQANGAGAGIESGTAIAHCPSVNWVSTEYGIPSFFIVVLPPLLFGGIPVPQPPIAGGTPATGLTNITKFNLGLGYNTRVPTTSTTTAVFAEPAIRETRLDFLPPLRSAQAGRVVYFAGAQVWSYDGTEITEAGFHVGPEVAAPTQSNGGSLTALGTYFYRVDICYKNAQGEEIRSLSILTTPVVLTGTNKTLTLTIPSRYTRRANSYFLIFRNAMASGVPLTNLWLLNSRDPTSAHYVKNDQGAASITFVDDGTLFSDVTIQKNELHPANSGEAYVQPTAAPACEIIAAGRDRVWVAGGELLPGQVAPSRLFDPGDTPSFNPYLNIQVDRSAEPLTAIGFVGEIAVFLRKNATYLMDGDGPDNVANGAWTPSRLAFADLGALGQESLALISGGLLFQGPAGIRLIGPSGSLMPIGQVVDEFVKTFTINSAVVIDHDQEVRWYGETETLVYNYLYDSWSRWTIAGKGAVRDFTTGLAIVAGALGTLLIESDGVFTDGGKSYTHRIRFPWLHRDQLGDFQRVKSIEGIGTWDPADGTHGIRLELYYDERTFPEEVFEWTVPNIVPAGLPTALPLPLGIPTIDRWGTYNWGDGIWGDILSTGHALSNLGWDWKRKPARQKCAVISVAIDDRGTIGAGFKLNALGLNIGKKPGLNRIPFTGGGTDTYR